MRTPFPAVLASLCLAILGFVSLFLFHSIAAPVVGLFLAFMIYSSVKVCYPWERAVVVRLGNYRDTMTPGMFVLMPGFDKVLDFVDSRIQSTDISAEDALTRDGVSVNVDAVVFWQIYDAKKAALEIKDYTEATNRVAQTTLREMIGAHDLTGLLTEREAADAALSRAIDGKTHEWGIKITSVEIRDVKIPASLMDAMSRKAQAEREKDARVILASAEVEIARKTAEAAQIYADSPIALQLRQMSLVYEMGKNGCPIIVPTDMAGSMGSTIAANLALTAAAKDK